MAGVHDVAAYIIAKAGEMTAMKLQKLSYYSQAWHLVWADQTLFDEEIQAWANGPVVYSLYQKHQGMFRVSEWQWGDASRLTADEITSIDAVIDAYGTFTAHQLSEMTNAESPWIEAREGLNDGARSSNVIDINKMYDYYSERRA